MSSVKVIDVHKPPLAVWREFARLVPKEICYHDFRKLQGRRVAEIADWYGSDFVFTLKDGRICVPDRNSGMYNVTSGRMTPKRFIKAVEAIFKKGSRR